MMGAEFEEMMKFIDQRVKERLAEPENIKVKLVGRRKRK